jgi:integrase/recombinase XerD
LNINTFQHQRPNSYSIAGASSHSGQRTQITRLAERGVDLKAIAEIAGHTSIRTTAMYVEANPRRLARILQDVTW